MCDTVFCLFVIVFFSSANSVNTLESTAGILTKRFSDHQPYFMLLNITQVTTESHPKFIKLKIVSEQAMINVKYEI